MRSEFQANTYLQQSNKQPVVYEQQSAIPKWFYACLLFGFGLGIAAIIDFVL